MNPRLEVRNPPVRRRALRPSLSIATGLATTAVLLGATAVLFQDPSYVPRVSLENRSEYDVYVDVSDSSGSSWLALGVATQHCTTTFHDVIDAGPTWTVRFRSQGVPAGQVTTSRRDLEAGGWGIVLPESVRSQLTSSAVPASPVQTCQAPPGDREHAP